MYILLFMFSINSYNGHAIRVVAGLYSEPQITKKYLNINIKRIGNLFVQAESSSKLIVFIRCTKEYIS